MSATPGLYLLRLRYAYRFDGDTYYDDGWRNPRNAPYERAFATREAAVAWGSATPPIHANPFDHADFYAGGILWSYVSSTGESKQEPSLEFYDYDEDREKSEDSVAITSDFAMEDGEEGGRTIGIAIAVDWLRDIIGVCPPSDALSERTAWIAWWDSGAGGATDEQKREIWRFFVPVPYTVVRVLEGVTS